MAVSSLGYAAVTSDPQISAAYGTKVLFLLILTAPCEPAVALSHGSFWTWDKGASPTWDVPFSGQREKQE